MPYRSLRDFIERLEQSGRLVRVKHPVSPVLEMTEIQTRLLAEGGPAVLFERVSRPGRRHYVGANDVPSVRNGLGIAILSTSRGLLSDRGARQEGVGGELMALVW